MKFREIEVMFFEENIYQIENFGIKIIKISEKKIFKIFDAHF